MPVTFFSTTGINIFCSVLKFVLGASLNIFKGVIKYIRFKYTHLYTNYIYIYLLHSPNCRVKCFKFYMDSYNPQASLLETDRASRTNLNVCIVVLINIVVLCFITYGLLQAESYFKHGRWTNWQFAFRESTIALLHRSFGNKTTQHQILH